MMLRATQKWLASLTLAGLLAPSLAFAQDVPVKAPHIDAKAFRHSDLQFETRDLEVSQLSRAAALEVEQSLAGLGAPVASARIDDRSGRFSTLLPVVPLVPGSGVGNKLAWNQLAPSREAREQAALEAFRAYLNQNRAALGIDMAELKGAQRIAAHDGDLYQIHLERSFDGIPVRGSYIAATINHGNLVLMTTHQWGDRPQDQGARQISHDAARAAVLSHLAGLEFTFEGKGRRLYVTLADGATGYRYPLVWALRGQIKGDGGNWEALVDAHTGELISFEDTNHYAEAKGGVLPVTNDGINPDGVEQAGWPMPFLTVTGGVTDTGGNAGVAGSLTATLSGTYIRMSDNCGAISLTQTDNLDFGTSTGTDCVTPGFGGAGNTHASRTGFYELNKIKESARGQLPANTWLTAQLTSNMNINQTCNAFWNGSTVNFYRSGGGCFNTGEIAGVFDHEWGHGMDANDVNGGIATPSGEGIADIYTALRLNNSCIGRNFRSTVCTGNGDPCLTCTGVRDIDYLKRQSGQPHNYTWSNANCAGSVHCVGGVYSEAVWSLWKRKLQSAPYNMDNNTAMEVTTRLTYIAAGNTGSWFSGGPPNGGCAGGSGYLNYLAADDDNGNLNDGTPHMTAIYQSFNDQQIACQTPTVQDSGCAGAPTTAPNVTATAGNNAVNLSWTAVSGATKYQIFRTEGVFACDFGKAKIGETTGTTFASNNLQSGRSYSYVVVPVGASNTCMGPASACDTAIPVGGGNNAPAVAITAPATGTSVGSGTSITFTGTANDLEDGNLTASLSWTSSINGAIGTGGSFATSSLSIGTHTITASVTDSGSVTGSAQITVTITAPPTVLTNGVPVTGIAGATGSNAYYTLAVPAGATNLSFTTSGGTGDADLYVRFGSTATTTTFDCSSTSATNTETCSFAAPQVGTYYVLLYGYATYSGVTLTGSYTGGGGGGPVTVTFISVAADDGRVIESTETSNVGGTVNTNAGTTSALRVGDTNTDTQQKSFLSFNTSSIPDTATITSATLRIKRGSLTGTNPFTTHGTCSVDISSAFGGATALAAGDFQAAAGATAVASMSNPATNGTFSTGALNASGLANINKTGTTQFRVYFTLDDNDDLGNDYMGFYSGNSAVGDQPELVITYTP